MKNNEKNLKKLRWDFDGLILNWKLALLCVVLKRNDHAILDCMEEIMSSQWKNNMANKAQSMQRCEIEGLFWIISKISGSLGRMKRVYIEILSEFSILETIFSRLKLKWTNKEVDIEWFRNRIWLFSFIFITLVKWKSLALTRIKQPIHYATQYGCEYSFACTGNAFELDHSNCKVFQTFDLRTFRPKGKGNRFKLIRFILSICSKTLARKYTGQLKPLHECVHGRWAALCKRITKFSMEFWERTDIPHFTRYLFQSTNKNMDIKCVPSTSFWNLSQNNIKFSGHSLKVNPFIYGRSIHNCVCMHVLCEPVLSLRIYSKERN